MCPHKMIHSVNQAHTHTIALCADKQRNCLQVMMHKKVINKVLERDVLILAVVLWIVGLIGTVSVQILVEMTRIIAVDVSTAYGT